MDLSANLPLLTSLLTTALVVAVQHVRSAQRSRERSLRVSSLHVYPVKGLRGHSVDCAPLDSRGMLWDRRWMLLRGGERSLFTTQRQVPGMATLEATVLLPPALAARAVPPAAVVDASLAAPALRLVATRGAHAGRSIVVPILTQAEGATVPCVLVWGSAAECVVDQGEAVAAWLTEVLGEGDAASLAGGEDGRAPPDGDDLRLRLVYFDPAASSRALKHAPPATAPPLVDGVAFSDGFPMLLASGESLADLNRRLPPGEGPLPMARFRPNIVVAADRAWAEDGWAQLRIGSVGLWGVKRCARCKVTTIDPATGTPHADALQPEPLATMKGFRGDRQASGDVYFGVNVVHERSDASGAAALRVGDAVSVVEAAPVPPL